MFIHLFLCLLHTCLNTFHHLLPSGTQPDASSPFQPAKEREWACSEPAPDPREVILGAWDALSHLQSLQLSWRLCCNSSSPFQRKWSREAQTSLWRSPPPDFFPVLQTMEMVGALELSMPALPWASVCFSGQAGCQPRVAMQGMVMLAASGWRCCPKGQGYLSSCIFCRLFLGFFFRESQTLEVWMSPARLSLIKNEFTLLPWGNQ